jgi:rhodanese-related sulfurtransferase
MDMNNNAISLEELKGKLEGNATDILVIDVRSKEEFDAQHIPIANNIPAAEFEKQVNEEWKGKMLVTVCNHGGNRSQLAAQLLRDHGLQQAFFLEGGTVGWFDNDSNGDSNQENISG